MQAWFRLEFVRSYNTTVRCRNKHYFELNHDVGIYNRNKWRVDTQWQYTASVQLL